MKLGEQLKHIRTSKNISIKSLASDLGIAEITLRQYESGKREPKISQLQKIAAKLGVSLNELLGIVDEDTQIDKIAEAFPNAPVSTYDDKIRINILNLKDSMPQSQEKVYNEALEKLNLLNYLGQQKARDYISDLAEQEKYLKKPPTTK